jgi:hypothetical protein
LKRTRRYVPIGILYLIILMFSLYIAIMYLFHDAASAPIVKSKLKDAGFSLFIWKAFFYPHIILGTLALAIGPFQMTSRSRRNPKVHRILGRIYASAIGLNILMVPYLAIYSTGGIPASVAFLVLDAAWLVTTGMGVWRIIQRNIAAHRRWILRSYAITWVFVSFRIVVALISIFTHAAMSISFPVAVYVSIAINLLLTEIYLRRRDKRAVSGIHVSANAR